MVSAKNHEIRRPSVLYNLAVIFYLRENKGKIEKYE